MKPKLAFIDHSFHKKTKSNNFLRDILCEHFNVIDIWDESWSGGEKMRADKINAQNFDYVLFFQVLPSISELKKIKAKLVWVPMYDGVVGRGNSFWKELSTVGIKVISFSKKILEITKKNNIDSIYVQYFLDPKKLPAVRETEGLTIFFWQRHSDFNFNHLRRMLADNDVKKIILRNEPDPGNVFVKPSKQDMDKYNIEIIDGDIGREKHIEILSGCRVFVSPRKFEGIGMAFIEAMTMGLAVVAYDCPTMNEYIKFGDNGYLFSRWWRLKKIDLSDFKQIGENAKEYCQKGFNQWETEKLKIARHITSEYNPGAKLDSITLLYVKMLRFLYSIIRKAGFNYEWL